MFLLWMQGSPRALEQSARKEFPETTFLFKYTLAEGHCRGPSEGHSLSRGHGLASSTMGTTLYTTDCEYNFFNKYLSNSWEAIILIDDCRFSCICQMNKECMSLAVLVFFQEMLGRESLCAG